MPYAAVRQNIEVVLATNDKDLFQLVDESVRIYTTNKADLASPKDSFALLDGACVQKKWGVPPERIGDIIALIGDSVDNIPGVAGLGPKNAAHLLKTHGSSTPCWPTCMRSRTPASGRSCVAARDQILQNREMVKLDTGPAAAGATGRAGNPAAVRGIDRRHRAVRIQVPFAGNPDRGCRRRWEAGTQGEQGELF